MDDMSAAGAPQPTWGPEAACRIRGPSLVQAPLLVVALMTGGATIAAVAWGFYAGNERSGVWWATVIGGAVLSVGVLAAARGCFIDIRDGEVRDVVAWFTVRRFRRSEVTTARVIRGPWRLYSVDLEDGRRFNLLGASPQQWPTRLLPGAVGRDRADLGAIMGEDEPGGLGPTRG